MNVESVKYLWLFLGWYCLWKAIRVYCVYWYRTKVEKGILKVNEYLEKLRTDVLQCNNWLDLQVVAKRIPDVLTFDITVDVNINNEPHSIDYEYTYNIGNKLKTVDDILFRFETTDHTQFLKTQQQLLSDIDNALDALQKEDY